jgi:hypothetical protein
LSLYVSSLTPRFGCAKRQQRSAQPLPKLLNCGTNFLGGDSAVSNYENCVRGNQLTTSPELCEMPSGWTKASTSVSRWWWAVPALARPPSYSTGSLPDRHEARGRWQSDTELLLPSVLSQAALLEGQLDEAGTLGAQALEAAAARLPDDRRRVMYARVALAAGNPRRAEDGL